MDGIEELPPDDSLPCACTNQDIQGLQGTDTFVSLSTNFDRALLKHRLARGLLCGAGIGEGLGRQWIPAGALLLASLAIRRAFVQEPASDAHGALTRTYRLHRRAICRSSP